MQLWPIFCVLLGVPLVTQAQDKIRVATFNASLNRDQAGALTRDLSTKDNAQAQSIAAMIQAVRPDVLLLQEFDYDEKGKAMEAFATHYLQVSQAGQTPIDYPYRWAAPSNTGIPTGIDLDQDGRQTGPGDAQGFGRHPGQYAFVVLSRIPFDPTEIRTFQMLRWAQMPGARLPEKDGRPWYSPAALAVLRLSSKNHVIVPIKARDRIIHLLAAHPTPPVFDGPEDRNGRRNADEIRLLADLITPKKSAYIIDDTGVRGGLPADASFIVMGDLNADPKDGDSRPGAIAQLLDHPRIHPVVANGKHTPISVGAVHTPAKKPLMGDRTRHTAQWGLRVDYVLPSRTLKIDGSGVFWPAPDDPMAPVVNGPKGGKAPTDHRLVWVDIRL